MNKHDIIYKLYPNVVRIDEKSKDSFVACDASEKEVNIVLSDINTEYQKEDYKRKRVEEYPTLTAQFDLQYWDQVNGTTKWKEAIAKVKADNPKPS